LRISRRKPKKKILVYRYRTNQYIRAEKVRVIDEDGQNLDVMPTSKALALARQKGLDLVEVSPVANPPVARIINYSKFKYEEEKEQRKIKAKQKKVETKIIRLSLRIGKHDKQVRLDSAKKFLEDNDKVKIELNLRGRERQHKNLAKQIIEEFIMALNSEIETRIEQKLNISGGKLDILIAKK